MSTDAVMPLECFSIRLAAPQRHGRAGPGHARLACGTTDVDARNKSGHDGTWFGSTISKTALKRRTRVNPSSDRERESLATRPQAQQMTHRVDEIGAVHGVEVEVGD